MKVNNIEASGGCYIAGHHGQYGLDRLADVCEQFEIAFDENDDPRHWRAISDESDNQQEVERAWDRLVWASDRLEELLNEHTTGGYWSWEDGEFFLVQTEVQAILFVRVEGGEDYDDAWRLLVEHGPAAAVTSYDQLDNGERAYTFPITIHYEPEEA
jgi:hypothetical protein